MPSQTPESDGEGIPPRHFPPLSSRAKGRLVLHLNWYPPLLDPEENISLGQFAVQQGSVQDTSASVVSSSSSLMSLHWMSGEIVLMPNYRSTHVEHWDNIYR